MRYAIVAIGSRGDVQPYLALATGLMERGHSVTLMAHENFREFVEGYGVTFHPLAGSVEGLLKTPRGMSMLRSGSILAFARYLRQVIRQTQSQVNDDIMQGALPADMLIASLLSVPWLHAIAEKMAKPWAIVALNLPSTRTAVFPLAGIDFFNFPAYNKLSYRLLETFHWINNKKPVNDFRRSLGLAPLQVPVLRQVATEKILTLYCYSPALRPRPADWGPETDITGFLFLPQSAREKNPADDLPADLSAWLAAGEAPVYIGFGSIPFPDPVLLNKMITGLLQKTTCRFVFCEGWSDPLSLPAQPRLFVLKAVNHDKLFPRCRTAIIHGGIGTTAAVLKAKIPVIIVSIIADQPWWGKIIAAKKAGSHIPFRKVTMQRLTAAIRTTEQPAIRAAALGLGEQINRENGLAVTIGRLETSFS